MEGEGDRYYQVEQNEPTSRGGIYPIDALHSTRIETERAKERREAERRQVIREGIHA